MATIKSCTDIPQSKVIEKILSRDTADMYYALSEDESISLIVCGKPKGFFDNIQVAWSLTALLGVLPEEVSLNSFIDGSWNAMVQRNSKMIYCDAHNPVDACYKLILKLHELKML